MGISEQERAALKIQFVRIFSEKYAKPAGALVDKISTHHEMGRYTVILWSPSQKCFHEETLNEHLIENQKRFVTQTQTDWIMLGIFKEKTDAQHFCRMMQEARSDFYKLGTIDIDGMEI